MDVYNFIQQNSDTSKTNFLTYQMLVSAELNCKKFPYNVISSEASLIETNLTEMSLTEAELKSIVKKYNTVVKQATKSVTKPNFNPDFNKVANPNLHSGGDMNNEIIVFLF